MRSHEKLIQKAHNVADVSLAVHSLAPSCILSVHRVPFTLGLPTITPHTAHSNS